MKRRISLVIAFALSFLMMFGSISRAEEIKVPISVQTSESTEIEIIIKAPLAKQTSQPEECDPSSRCGECKTSSGNDGIWKTAENGSAFCKPCIAAVCGACTTSTGACGVWQTGLSGPYCKTCNVCGQKLTVAP